MIISLIETQDAHVARVLSYLHVPRYYFVLINFSVNKFGIDSPLKEVRRLRRLSFMFNIQREMKSDLKFHRMTK